MHYDYAEHGVKIGLEVHQQIDGKKLFCGCPTILSEPLPDERLIYRKLAVVRSETGEIDPAAAESGAKASVYCYQVPSHTCLVETDDEPPHAVEQDVIDFALEVALMLGSTPVDEIQFMRKIVIDGSNTSGFQRTALVSTGGSVAVGGRKIGISTICLEEDAARIMDVHTVNGEVVYRLDRLGIPLIEIATEPVIDSPELAMEVAGRIGAILRATGKVKRGIGTIREDLNISIAEGARVEIKGVQELKMVPEYITKEIARQNDIIEAMKNLRRRTAGKQKQPAPSEYETIRDCTDIIKESSSGVLRHSMKNGGRVMGAPLYGFGGILKKYGLGRELAGYAKSAGVNGIIHSDEMPAYGMTEQDDRNLRMFFSLTEIDAYVIVAGPEAIAKKALFAVLRRARMAYVGVPEETREPMPDGTTSYSRPLPGRARMYPETDIPAIRVDGDRLNAIRSNLPEMPERMIERLKEDYGLNDVQASQLVNTGLLVDFEKIVSVNRLLGSLVARTLLNTLPEIYKDQPDLKKIDTDDLIEVFRCYDDGLFAKEGIPLVLSAMAKKSCTARDAVRESGLEIPAGAGVINEVVDRIISDNIELIKKRGGAAAGPLMGIAMKKLRGKIDGRKLNEMILSRIHEIAYKNQTNSDS